MEKKKEYNICVIGGDGIGPEVIASSCRVLESTRLKFRFIQKAAGYGCYRKTGFSLPRDTIAAAKIADAILFGAVTTPPNIDGYQSPIIALRRQFNLFANVRPISPLPITGERSDIDFVIVRENTEDLYIGEEEAIKDGFVAKRVITRTASERIIRFAFELAKKQNRSLVTVVHKANVLRKTDGLFLEIAQSIAKEYPKIILEDMLVDSAAMRIIKNPEHFQILVTTNMFGDILSDEASALVGGLGVVPSANIGNGRALFEPTHGSAPKYAGKNIANPLASFRAVEMMLEFFGEATAAIKLQSSINSVLQKGIKTKDLDGSATTTEFTQAVIDKLKIL